MILFLAWTVSMVIGCSVTGAVVRRNTTERVTAEVTSELRQGFQKYLEELEQERMAASLLKDDESRQAVIQAEATAMAKSFYGHKDVIRTDADYYTLGWNECFRAAGDGEFKNLTTIEAVVSQKGQYLGWNENNPVVEKLYAIALEIVTDYYNGNWPTTDEFIYLDWSTGKMVARNEFKTGPSTEYWWWGK